MIVTKSIEKTLRDLDKLYNKNGVTIKLQKYYAKLAILELAGWVEESFDRIAKASVYSSLRTSKYREKTLNIIKENYGFDYEKNFIGMMIKLVGIRKVERVEKLQTVERDRPSLKSIIGTLKRNRNIHAHTYIKGATQNIIAPSRTLSDFKRIVNMLENINRGFLKK